MKFNKISENIIKKFIFFFDSKLKKLNSNLKNVYLYLIYMSIYNFLLYIPKNKNGIWLIKLDFSIFKRKELKKIEILKFK